MTIKPITPFMILPMILAISIAGCSKKDGDKAATQVVAKVNGAEISLHQINHVLSKAGNVPADQLDRARKTAVDRLIDQELLAAKAVEEKLDRTPETLMTIEMARREILARARVEQLMAAASKLNSGDVTKYYVTHPELFAERQIYSLQEISFPTQKEGVADVQALVDKGAAMNDIQALLRSRNVQFGTNAGIRAAEQLPLEMLKVLHATKEGGMLLNSSPQGHTVVKVVGIRKMPVDEATARPKIQAFLINQRVAEVTTNELKSLKTTAKIEYVGSLADLPKPDTSPRQGPGAASTNLPALPQLDQLPVNTGDNNAKK
jgi:EpsD family peptidyl-prolyl cis-trans isomerase